MGAPTDMLVVVATMYDNPQGLTKEEILDKFSKIKLRSPLGIEDYLKSGLHGFTQLFNLEHTRKYLENRKKYWNEEYKYFSKRSIILLNHFYEVIETSHESIGKTEIQYESVDSSSFEDNLFKGNEVGRHVYQGDFTEIKAPKEFENPKYSYIVRKILNKKIEEEEDDGFSFIAKVNETLEVEVVKFNSKIFKFNSPGELWKAYPEYHPENTHNFNQETGFLYPHQAYGIYSKNPSFKWIKKGDKYFLDFEHFSKIISTNSYFGKNNWKHPGQKEKSKYSLTDVVLTSEAIRRKNWKKLGYNAFFGTNKNFIYKNENTLRRYERAVLEMELYAEAQKKGWTNSEFLREYHFRIAHMNQVPYEEIKKILKQENKMIGIKKRKFTIRKKKEQEKQKDEQEFPF